ncbi:hypothetical protein [Mycobacterium sp. AZCC_0083]|uniref:DUF7255 family protein n=1 Tax=Mycobacterium sp. AZCC_0083 TaxID=2735882 RepID=UPI0017A60773|nr:hypothetical protein [Mycobacterium sp. AZCC_0083]MBB5161579.1 hypothetical protein [Mycobacterium sp. AZCC_0083]
MVRTGARANALQILFSQVGHSAMSDAPPVPRLDTLPPNAREEVLDLFRALGGQTPMPPLRPGAWDLVFADGLVVELDEELHFNRYRAQSLQPTWATDLPWYDVYLGLCRDREQECLAAGKWGKRWTNPSCETMFGSPSPPGVLDEHGSPRWKQRALYDTIKDIAALHSSVFRLCRLSVWDSVGDTMVGDALAGAAIEREHLADFIGRRTI